MLLNSCKQCHTRSKCRTFSILTPSVSDFHYSTSFLLIFWLFANVVRPHKVATSMRQKLLEDIMHYGNTQ